MAEGPADIAAPEAEDGARARQLLDAGEVERQRQMIEEQAVDPAPRPKFEITASGPGGCSCSIKCEDKQFAFGTMFAGLSALVILRLESPQLLEAVKFGTAAAIVGTFTYFYMRNKENTERATRDALEGRPTDGAHNPDPEIEDIQPGSLIVKLRCHTEESLVQFVQDYDSGKVKQCLEKELSKIGFTKEVTVTIENREELEAQSMKLRRLEPDYARILKKSDFIADNPQKESTRGDPGIVIIIRGSGGERRDGTCLKPPSVDKIMQTIAACYLDLCPPQSLKESHNFRTYLQDVCHLLISADETVPSLRITVKCKSLKILNELWQDYISGNLNEIAQRCLVTDEVLRKYNLKHFRLETTIERDDYKRYKAEKFAGEESDYCEACGGPCQHQQSESQANINTIEWDSSSQESSEALRRCFETQADTTVKMNRRNWKSGVPELCNLLGLRCEANEDEVDGVLKKSQAFQPSSGSVFKAPEYKYDDSKSVQYNVKMRGSGWCEVEIVIPAKYRRKLSNPSSDEFRELKQELARAFGIPEDLLFSEVSQFEVTAGSVRMDIELRGPALMLIFIGSQLMQTPRAQFESLRVQDPEVQQRNVGDVLVDLVGDVPAAASKGSRYGAIIGGVLGIPGGLAGVMAGAAIGATLGAGSGAAASVGAAQISDAVRTMSLSHWNLTARERKKNAQAVFKFLGGDIQLDIKFLF